MGRIIILLAAAAILCSGCANNYRDTTLYQRSGRTKPIVAVMPVINSSDADTPTWDVALELTEEIRKRIFDSPKLYLLRDGGSVTTAQELNTPDPSGLPKNARENLGAAEFVVVAELIDQHETSYGLDSNRPFLEEVGSVLSVAMRIRVIDVRKGEPQVILQEIINQDHMVSRPYLKTDYTKAHWGTEAFDRTPLGLAHSKVVREIVSRVEGYVVARKG